MKKSLSLLVIVVAAACLVGFAFGRITPAAQPAQTSSVVHAGLNSTGPTVAPAVPLASLAQPVAVVVTGLVCALFGILAVAPLLLNEPGP